MDLTSQLQLVELLTNIPSYYNPVTNFLKLIITQAKYNITLQYVCAPSPAHPVRQAISTQ